MMRWCRGGLYARWPAAITDGLNAWRYVTLACLRAVRTVFRRTRYPAFRGERSVQDST